jgi:hypothetical protein
MKNNIFTFAVLFVLFLSCLVSAQDINGIQGGTVKAVSVTVEQMLKSYVPYSGPVEEKPEGEPPYAPRTAPPEVSALDKFTYDKSSGENPSLAPVVGTGFEGITQSSYIPSEPTVAVGPNHVFSPGNSTVTITNKDGSGRTEISGNTFFGAPSSEGGISDAVCCYDAIRGRYVALCFTYQRNMNNYYLMISQTSDARGAWWQYKFDWRIDGSTVTKNFGDFEEFGFSDDKFVISSQQFSFAGQYKYQKLRVFDLASLYSGASVTWVDFVKFSAPPGGDISSLFVTKPGRNLSPGDNTIYCLTTRYNGGSTVAYRTVTGTPTNPLLSAGSLISVNTYGAPVKAKGGSSTATVTTNDCRTTNFVVRNGYLHIAWHFGLSYSGTTYDAVRYLKLNVTNPSSPVKVTDETFGASGVYYYYPTCTVDSYGNVFMGFGRSSATEYPSSWVTGKRTTDAAIEPSVLAKSGLAVTSQSRWGDYTGIDMDETASGSTESVAWYSGQWTKTSNAFGTWVTKLTFASPSANVTKVTGKENSLVKERTEFNLQQNFPNPFNPVSVITYSIPYESKVTLKVYDVLGREIETLVSAQQAPGTYNATFNGQNYMSGVYFYKLYAENGVSTISKTMQMILIK